MSDGYATNASSDPTFEIAKSRYGCGAEEVPSSRICAWRKRAYHDWRSGPVADSVTNGTPMRSASSHSTLVTGCDVFARRLGSTAAVSCAIDATSNAMYAIACVRGPVRVTNQCASKYPSSSAHWKKTRHAVQTAAEPPSSGMRRLPAIGSIRNSRELLRKIATA